MEGWDSLMTGGGRSESAGREEEQAVACVKQDPGLISFLLSSDPAFSAFPVPSHCL